MWPDRDQAAHRSDLRPIASDQWAEKLWRAARKRCPPVIRVTAEFGGSLWIILVCAFGALERDTT